MDNLNSFYLITITINAHAPNNYMVKLLITSIVQHITYFQYKMTIQKVRAHTRIKENDMTYSITVDDNTTPCIHIGHNIAYRSTKPNMLNKEPTNIHKSKTQ